MILQTRFMLMVALLFVCSASVALGASVTITPSGNGAFVLLGNNMDGVSGFTLTVGYDPSALSSPSVSWGSLISGAVSGANTSVPGSIRIAIVRVEPFSGSGPIAAITFATHKGSGGITSFTVDQMIDSSKANVTASSSIESGTTGTATAGSGLVTAAGIPFSQSAPTTAPVPAGPGTVTLPGDSQPKGEVQTAGSKETQEPKTAPPLETAEVAEIATTPAQQPIVEKSAETIEPVAVKPIVYGSVLDRFRTYRGEKTPEILVALFTKEVSPAIHQEPAVVISDGKATVRITVDLSLFKGTSTSFALTGAQLVSLKREEDSDTWILEALPRLNSIHAAVIAVNSSSNIEFPLTVVSPSVQVSAKRADFSDFLKDGEAKTPKHDLNGDGRHDYLDDFIYTAHYLIKSSAAAKNAR